MNLSKYLIAPAVLTGLMIGGTLFHSPKADEASPLISFSKWQTTHKNQRIAHFKILNQSGPARIVTGHAEFGGKPLNRATEEKYTASNHFPLDDQYALPDSADQLGPAYTFLLGNDLSKQPNGIDVQWPDAVEYNGQKLGVDMFIPAEVIKQNPYKSPTGEPYVSNIYGYKARNMIQVSNNFARGIRYSGFDQGQAQFRFYKNNDFNSQPVSIKGAPLSFDSLNGMASTQALANAWPYSLVSGPMFRDKYNYAPLTGEFTFYSALNGDWGSTPGIVESKPKTNIRKYRSSLLNEDVTGGYQDRQFYDWNMMRGHWNNKKYLKQFYKNSIVFIAGKDPTSVFNWGNGDGYQWWRLSSHMFPSSHQRKPPLKKSTSQDGNTKSGKSNVLKLKGDTTPYTYTITGKIPRSGSHYWLYDHIPAQADNPHVTSVSGVPSDLVTSSGHDLHLDLSQKEKDAHYRVSPYAGKKFTITVQATPDTDALMQYGQTFTNGVRVRQSGHKPVNRYATDYAPLGTKNITPPKPRPATPTPITKKVSHHTMVHPGEEYTYSIHGQIPGDWHYYNAYVDPSKDSIDGEPSSDSVKTDVNDTGDQNGSSNPTNATRPEDGVDQTPNYATSYYQEPYSYSEQEPVKDKHGNVEHDKNGNTKTQSVTVSGYNNESTSYIKSWNVYPYRLYNAHPGDEYNLSDYLPKDTSFVSLEKTDGLPVNVDNNHLTMDLNAGNEDGTQKHEFYNTLDIDDFPYMNGNETEYGGNDDPDTLQRFAGKKFTIKVRVKADHLPNTGNNNKDGATEQNDPSGGYDDSNLPKDPDEGSAPRSDSFKPQLTHNSGWYNWYNQATTDEQLYTKNGDNLYHKHSNIVRNRIRVIKYHRYNYDYNHDQNGKGTDNLIPTGVMPGNSDHSLNDDTDNRVSASEDRNDGGDNDQFHRYYTSDDLIPGQEAQDEAQPQLGYEGTSVKVPLIDTHNNYTTADGKSAEARYRFGYQPDWDMSDSHAVYPILGGFDSTNAHKSGYGDVMPFNDRPDKDESSTFHYSGSDDSGNDPVGSNNYDDTNQRFSMDFYKPYFIPRQHTHNGDDSQNGKDGSGDVRFITDTDKAGNGIPFRLDLVNNDYMYGTDGQTTHGIENEFLGDTMHLQITDPDESGDGIDGHKIVYDLNNIDPTRWIKHEESQHDDEYIEFRSKLDTSKLDAQPGQRVPLHVNLTFNSPDHDAQLDGFTTDSHAYIADQHTIDGQSFTHDGKPSTYAKDVAPERTIKYGVGDADNPRVQFEELYMQQDHKKPATFITGYPMRNDSTLSYYGLLGEDDLSRGEENADDPYAGANAYGSHKTSDQWADGDDHSGNKYGKRLTDGTIMDFGFPSSFDKKYNTYLKHSSQMPDSSVNGNDGVKDGHKANRVDRLQHANDHNDMQPYDDSNLATADNGKSLDTLSDNTLDNYASQYDTETFSHDDARRLDNLFDTENSPEDLMAGKYSTDYDFYPRKVERDSGKSDLLNDDDPLTKQAMTSSDGFVTSYNKNTNSPIDRIFTPLWLPLSTDDKSAQADPDENYNVPYRDYNTVMMKNIPSRSSDGQGDADATKHGLTSNDDRLGGQFWNIAESRPDAAVGHAYEADTAPKDGKRSRKQLIQDQKLSGNSLQPTMTGNHGRGMAQSIKGFGARALHALQNLF